MKYNIKIKVNMEMRIERKKGTIVYIAKEDVT